MLYPWPVGVKLVSCARVNTASHSPSHSSLPSHSQWLISSELLIWLFQKLRPETQHHFHYSFSHNIFFYVSLKPHIESATAKYSSAHGLACPITCHLSHS